MVGTYPGKTLDAGEGYYMRTTGTSIYRATTPVALPPFSCYLPSAEKRSLFKLEEAETGIESIQNSKLKIQNDDAVYDLTGRKIVNSKSSNSKLPKGLYIQNGKKIFVRSND